MSEEKEVIKAEGGVVNIEAYAMSVTDIVRQVQTIQHAMRAVMKDNEHYGVIPGTTGKPSLLKPGAEKLSMLFRIAPRYEITKNALDNGHREYEIVCSMFHIPTGTEVGQGVGSCTTMEGKYRFRKANLVCPNCGKETIIKGKAEFGGGWICYAKKGGCGNKWSDKENPFDGVSLDRIEHDNPADYYNTVMKMAKKRAHVDAILTVTAASDIFTQDIEDMVEVFPGAGAPGSGSAGKKPPVKPPTARSNVKILAEYVAEVDAIESVELLAKWYTDNVKKCQKNLTSDEQAELLAFFKAKKELIAPTVQCPNRDNAEILVNYCVEECTEKDGCPAHD